MSSGGFSLQMHFLNILNLNSYFEWNLTMAIRLLSNNLPLANGMMGIRSGLNWVPFDGFWRCYNLKSQTSRQFFLVAGIKIFGVSVSFSIKGL